MKKAFCLMMFGLVVLVSSAHAEEAVVPLDDIYTMDTVNFKFKPPAGWKMVKKETRPVVQLCFQQQSEDASLNSISIIVCPVPATEPFDIERLMNSDTSDTGILDKNIIEFSDFKAFSSTSLMSGLKMRNIQFVDNGNLFTISFVANEKYFNKLLPVIDENLKSFQLISSEPFVQELAAPKAVSAGVGRLPAVLPANIPLLSPIVAEPFKELAPESSVVNIALKSGTKLKGKVLAKTDKYFKIDFYGVPLKVNISDIGTIEEIPLKNANS